MEIKGWHKVSLIDYPEKVSTLIFTYGCNLRCPYCHNPELVLKRYKKHLQNIKECDIIEFIKKKNANKKWIDGISICGGEPTIQNDLINFCKKIKDELGIKIKIDTNGTNPTVLKKLIDNKLVDYIAMDVKVDLLKDKKYKKSVELVKEMKDYEFRLTVVPKLITEENIEKIIENFKNAKRFYLQKFEKRGNLLSNSYKNITNYKKNDLEKMCKKISKYFKKCEVRG